MARSSRGLSAYLMVNCLVAGSGRRTQRGAGPCASLQVLFGIARRKQIALDLLLHATDDGRRVRTSCTLRAESDVSEVS